MDLERLKADAESIASSVRNLAYMKQRGSPEFLTASAAMLAREAARKAGVVQEALGNLAAEIETASPLVNKLLRMHGGPEADEER